MVAGLALAAAGVGWLWWEVATREPQAGAGGAARVERFESEGDAHVRPGQIVRYRTDPPTSGPHDPVATVPGFYDRVQAPEKLVHALEHGNIVIYYDRPDPAVLDTLKEWARRHRGTWDGVVVTPYPGLKRAVILTAWQHRLRLEEFDAAAADAFMDQFRGRGPEKPVR
ncbi:MAG: DUF3105 domain-containing protein [Betaproteobacteria bacterium]|nr:DUF3105 domain-containing protein [Betaproteobacteria bacterium]